MAPDALPEVVGVLGAIAAGALGFLAGKQRQALGPITTSPIVLEVSAKPVEVVLDVKAPPTIALSVAPPSPIALQISHEPVQLSVAQPEPIAIAVKQPEAIVVRTKAADSAQVAIGSDTCHPATGYHATPHSGGGCILG